MPNNELVVWSSPNGIQLPADFAVTEDSLQLVNKQLTKKELMNISIAWSNHAYDMAAEYVWTRTVNKLRQKLGMFGVEFIMEMLGQPSPISIEDISTADVIDLSADLGIINETAKLKFTQTNEILHHYASGKNTDDFNRVEAERAIMSCLQYVLGSNDDLVEFEFSKFRDELKLTTFSEITPSYQLLIGSPYFHKRTTMRTLINLIKTTTSAEFEHVSSNATLIIPSIWESLTSDDRWPLGFSYAEAVNSNKQNLVKVFKACLLKVKGFDYVPENLRSISFIDAAKNIMNVHNEFNNFYNEPEAILKLQKMGTTIPNPAFGPCMNALMCCKIGNFYNVSSGAQPIIDKIFSTVSRDRWHYYFSSVFPVADVVLYKLSRTVKGVMYTQLSELLSTIKLTFEEVTNVKVRNFLNTVAAGKYQVAAEQAEKLYIELRTATEKK